MGFPVSDYDLKDLTYRLWLEGSTLGAGQQPTQFVYPQNYLFNGSQDPKTGGGLNGTVLGGSATGVSIRVGIARAAYVEYMSAWASEPLLFTFTHGYGNNGYRGPIGPTPFVTEPRCFVMPNEFVSVSAAGRVYAPANTEENKIVASGAFHGFQFACDFNFSAKHTIYVLGDSNTEATAIHTSIATSGLSCEDVWPWIVKKQLNAWGNDVRVIDKSMAGKNTSFYEALRQQRRLQLPTPPNMIFYCLGTNDINATTYQSNLSKFVNWALEQWPKTKIVVLGPASLGGTYAANAGPTLDGTAKEAMMVQIRNAGQQFVTSLNKPNQVIYINLGSKFHFTDNQFYSGTEDDPADNAHWGAQGHAAVAERIIEEIDATYPLFKKL